MSRPRNGREPFNVSINKTLTMKLKALSMELRTRQNVLVVEALFDLLNKYEAEIENIRILQPKA